jgi:bile acid-coenzyme A ligase
MGDLLRFHRDRKPANAPALTHPEGVLSWSELEARANRRAHLLRDAGVVPGDVVTLSIPNSNAVYETSFAIWKLGATPNVIASKLPPAEIRAIVDLVKPKVVVGLESGPLSGAKFIPVDADLSGFSPEPISAPPARYWKAMTSGGSTGRPKVIVDHRPAVWNLEDIIYGQRADGCVLNPGPLYHNAPYTLTHVALFSGSHLVGMRRFDAAEALRLIQQYRVNWVSFVPTMMNRIWNLPDRETFDISSLELVWHMAAPMPPALKEQWIHWLGGDRLWELYGGTEGQGVTVISGTEWLRKRGSVGKIYGNAKVKAFDESGRECAPGEIGEIYFWPAEGPGSTYHYVGAEPKVHRGWESIGDIGWIDEDGYVFLADRRTDLILRGGANIYPAEIEAALYGHSDVETAVVIGLPDADLGARVHAIVQPKTGVEPSVASFSEFLAERLALYKLPESYEFVEQALRDDAGKVRRSALRLERIGWMEQERAFRLPARINEPAAQAPGP